jgi:hypothetical protein
MACRGCTYSLFLRPCLLGVIFTHPIQTATNLAIESLGERSDAQSCPLLGVLFCKTRLLGLQICCLRSAARPTFVVGQVGVALPRDLRRRPGSRKPFDRSNSQIRKPHPIPDPRAPRAWRLPLSSVRIFRLPRSNTKVHRDPASRPLHCRIHQTAMDTFPTRCFRKLEHQLILFVPSHDRLDLAIEAVLQGRAAQDCTCFKAPPGYFYFRRSSKRSRLRRRA